MVRPFRSPLAELWNEMTQAQAELGRWFNSRPSTAPALALNVWEEDHQLVIEADLPGMVADKLDVTITEGNQLTIQGERTPFAGKQVFWHRQERPAGTFTRSVTLPVMVDTDKVEAHYEQGVLRLTLPKSEAAKPRRIAVKSD